MDEVTLIINTLGRRECMRNAIRSLAENGFSDKLLIALSPDCNAADATYITNFAVGLFPAAEIVVCPSHANTLYAQRTYAASCCTTDWIAFLDDDDSFESLNNYERAKRELRFIANYIVLSPRYIALKEGWYNPLCFLNYYPSCFWLTSWNVFFPRKLYILCVSQRDSSIRRCEDTVRWLRLLPRISFVRVINSSWIEYATSRHDGHVSFTPDAAHAVTYHAEYLECMRSLRQQYPSSPLTIY